jgi:hypothetical protein
MLKTNVFKKLAASILMLPVFIIFAFLSGSPVSAQLFTATTGDIVSGGADAVAGQAGLNDVAVGLIIAVVVKAALGLLAVIFLILMIYAGFTYMIARGNEEKTSKALATIRMAIIGIIITLGAYAIAYFVFKYLPFSGSQLGPNPITN